MIGGLDSQRAAVASSLCQKQLNFGLGVLPVRRGQPSGITGVQFNLLTLRAGGRCCDAHWKWVMDKVYRVAKKHVGEVKYEKQHVPKAKPKRKEKRVGKGDWQG